MRAILLAIFVVLGITSNTSFILNSMLEGKEVTIGPYNTSVSVGNLTQEYYELEPEDVTASRNAVQLIELLRRMFGVGIFTMPPLDPFTSNKLKPLVVGPNTFISGKVLLKSLTVTGAKNFQLKLFQLRMKTGRVDFDINIPEIHFNVDFETNLHLGGLLPLYLKGQLRGQINELTLTGALQTEVRRRKGLGPKVVFQVSGASVHIRANDIKVELVKGMRLDNDWLQTFYAGEDNSSFSHWITSTRDKIVEYAVNTFISLANKVLRGLSVVQVNAYLLYEDKAANSSVKN